MRDRPSSGERYRPAYVMVIAQQDLTNKEAHRIKVSLLTEEVVHIFDKAQQESRVMRRLSAPRFYNTLNPLAPRWGAIARFYSQTMGVMTIMTGMFCDS
jgi:hypothetical protein